MTKMITMSIAMAIKMGLSANNDLDYENEVMVTVIF